MADCRVHVGWLHTRVLMCGRSGPLATWRIGQTQYVACVWPLTCMCPAVRPLRGARRHSVTQLGAWGLQDGRTAVYLASEKGHLPVLKLLAERKASLDKPGGSGRFIVIIVVINIMSIFQNNT